MVTVLFIHMNTHPNTHSICLSLFPSLTLTYKQKNMPRQNVTVDAHHTTNTNTTPPPTHTHTRTHPTHTHPQPPTHTHPHTHTHTHSQCDARVPLSRSLHTHTHTHTASVIRGVIPEGLAYRGCHCVYI